MKYKGIELIEMLPENWDGKSRNMLVWCDDTKPIHHIVCGYDPIHCVWLVAETQAVWKYCAEIPIVAEEDVMKLLNDNEKEILALKAENDELKANIRSLKSERYDMASAVSGAVWKELMDRAKNIEGLVNAAMPGFGFNDISDIVLNKILEYMSENKTEKKFRRMTNKELAKWCAEGKGIFKNDDGNMTYTDFGFNSNEMNEPVGDWIHICGFDEKEWHEPLIEE